MSDQNNTIFDFFVEPINNSSDSSDHEYMKSYLKYADDFINRNVVHEEILSPEKSRYVAFPIKYPDIWNNYKLQEAAFWVAEEVNLSDDVSDWDNKLTDNDRRFISHVLAFFAASDGIVNANIKKNMIDMITIREAEVAYGYQYMMENVHNEAYAIMLETYIKDPIIRNNLFNSIETMPVIKMKKDWCEKWIDSDKTFAHKLIAFSIVEGVFFSGSFASIFWVGAKEDAPMRGLVFANKQISKDEDLHVDLACLIYSHLKNKLKESVVYEILEEAVSIEDYFITSAIPCKLLGMNSDLMKRHIRYVSDRLLKRLGYKPLYNVNSAFEFMEKINLERKQNMFEGRNSDYVKSSVINNKKDLTLLNNF